MFDYEKLGVFYLGKVFDPERRVVTDEPYLYDAKDLTTHAAVIGMTGSGKTGLCLSLLEEAAIDGIPAIAIDPKGDIGNLMLMFPNLDPQEFLPWVDAHEAGRLGVSVEDLAASTAKKWRDGLSEWHQDAARIARLKASTDVAIYTPGSSAGLPLSVLRSLAAPPAAVMEDADAYRQRVSSSVAGLLALLGIGNDSLDSREHILIANIVDQAWREGKDLEMAPLLRQIQSPPFDKVGFLDLESFYPSSERFELVSRLNNLFASPSFSGWMQGAPLDVSKLLHSSEGKARISIMSIAHLSDAERMFFVTILLSEILSWMRTQSGTSSLRAILYMDEIFGYFPPSANPPSKQPMLTLLKQARAYGLGVVLATQNPVDLDYKGLANTGTWFLGRLQTERDKLRVLDGLEGASSSAGFAFDRSSADAMLSALSPRTFLVNNIHERGPVLIQSRWALSYLRGPLTREQIQRLMKDHRVVPSAAQAESPVPKPIHGAGGHRPMVPPGVEELFFPSRQRLEAATSRYRAGLLGIGQAHFVNAKAGIDCWEKVHVLQVLDAEIPHPAWEGALLDRSGAPELAREPDADVPFGSLLPELVVPKNHTAWTNELKQYLYQQLHLRLWRCAAAKLNSNVQETQGEFKVRVRQALSEARDRQIEKLRAKYAPKAARLTERLRKAEQRREREQSQANTSTIQAGISVVGSILSAILGRKKISATNVGRASSAARSAGGVLSQRGDVARADEDIASLEKEIYELEATLGAEVVKIKEKIPIDDIALEELVLRPRKADLTVTKVALVWTPWTIDRQGLATPAFSFVEAQRQQSTIDSGA